MDPCSSGGSIARVIINAVVRFGDRPAISDASIRWTYTELGAEIGRFIAVYQLLGLKKGDGLAVLTTNRAEAWAAICATNIMGLRYTPLHPLSSEDDQAFVAADAQITALLVDSRKFGQRGLALKSRIPSLKNFLSLGPVDGAQDLLADLHFLHPAPLVDCTGPEDLVWLTYTGGTTGRSKGVMLSHRSVAAMTSIIASEWEWPETLRYAAITPLSHAAGILIYPVMLRGGSVHFINGFDTHMFCETVQNEKITSVFLVPTILSILLESKERLLQFDLTSLRLIIYGAAPASPHLLQRGIEIFGPIFLQLYGQSEAPNVITILRKSDHNLSMPHLLGSCGMASSLTEVKLFDAQMQQVADGEAGEICVQGPLCCSGYWNQPELTEALFAGGWLHTGDVAIRDSQGYFYIVDRTKDLIISGGFNIYPREVEDALMSHGDVLMAGVIGIPDPKWGEAVKAFVTVRKGATVDTTELCEHVKAKRGAPWAPKSIDFLEALPLTPLGKLDRKTLRAPYWQGQKRGVS